MPCSVARPSSRSWLHVTEISVFAPFSKLSVPLLDARHGRHREVPRQIMRKARKEQLPWAVFVVDLRRLCVVDHRGVDLRPVKP